MMHYTKDLYTFKGKTYTKEALSKLLNKDVTTLTREEEYELKVSRKSGTCNYNTPNRASFEYITLQGIKTAWRFGEKVFYDTEEERDAMRKEYHEDRNDLMYRNKLLKQIEELSTEELEKILKNLNKSIDK